MLLLGRIHILVGPDKDILEGVIQTGVIECRSMRDGKRDIKIRIMLVEAVNRLFDELDLFRHLFFRDLFQDRDEFVAADAVGVLTSEGGMNGRCRTLDDSVAGLVTVAVIDRFQIIDIEYCDCEVCLAVVDLFFQMRLNFDIGGGIADLGQGVGACLGLNEVEIAPEVHMHGADAGSDPFNFITAAGRSRPGFLRGFRGDIFLIVAVRCEFIEEHVHVVGKHGQFIVKRKQTFAEVVGQQENQNSADQDRQRGNDTDRKRVLTDLPVIPFGVVVNADNTGNLSAGVKDGAVGTVEVSPFILGRRIIYCWDSFGCADQRIGNQYFFAKLTRIDRIGVNGEDEGVALSADGIDEFDIDVVLEYGQLLIDAVVFLGADRFCRQSAKLIAVQQACGGIGDVEHAFADHLLNGRSRLYHHDHAQYDVGQYDQYAEDHKILRGHTYFFLSWLFHQLPCLHHCIREMPDAEHNNIGNII